MLVGFLSCVVLGAVSLAEPAYSIFFRNQEDAAVRLPVSSEAEVSGSLEGEIAGLAVAPQAVRLTRGEGFVTLPFDPGGMSEGRYPWCATLKGVDGRELASAKGVLRVLPRLDRDAFKTMSWGGWKKLSPAYLKSHGINSVNVHFRDVNFKAYLESGMFLNLRVEDSKTPEACRTFDLAKAAADARKRFAPYQGLHTWRTTLVNTEVYGGRWIGVATNMPAWCALARKDLGYDPVFRYTNPPVELDYKALGCTPYAGVLPSSREIDSLLWFLDAGLPVYRLNDALREMLHGLSPDNVVWTEPPYATCGLFRYVDASASWIYDYPVGTCVSNFRRMFAAVRPFGKRCYPTLGDGYWHRRTPRGWHPTAKDPKKPDKPLQVRCGQSADELMIKSWLAMASAPSEGLSYFACDVWDVGEANARKFAAEPASPVKFIAEPGSTARYGAFMRDTFLPAAELLRNMTNAPAAVAMARLAEVSVAGDFGWKPIHYTSCLSEHLGDAPVASDFLLDNEFTVEALCRYRYVILPMLKVVTKAHDAVIREAAARGVTFVVDSYCPIDYPGAVRLPLVFRPGEDPFLDIGTLRRDFLAWYETKYGELRACADAKSDEDGPDVFTLEKRHCGARYVTVVNNTRDAAAKTAMHAFCTNDWYHPVGAPRRITTHLRLPEGAAVYDFTDGGRRLAPNVERGEAVLTFDYKAAEGRLFSVYPTPLKELRLKTGGTFAPGGRAWVGVGVADAKGHAAPGRQIVELTLTDPEGNLHDASGRYTAENGRVVIPQRFARDAACGSWKASFRELTTGLTAETSFVVTGKRE